MERHQLTTAEDARNFIKAGHAIVTFESQATGMHLTYKVCRSDDGNVWFVKFLNGPNNENDYSYLGIIDRTGRFKLTKKSKAGYDSKVYKAFAYVWNAIKSRQLPTQVQIWHEGNCGRCGRTLTVPESLANGIGPICAELMSQ